MLRWLRHLKTDRVERSVPVAEPMEPRLLYSADVAAGLALATAVDPAAEQRTLTDTGEYASTATATSSVIATYASAPLHFEANQGQVPAGVDYVANGSGYGIALAGGNATLSVAGSAGAQAVGLVLVGAKAEAQGQAQDPQAATSNYIFGSDPSQWKAGIANYGSVVYHGVYQGVDVRYYGTQSQLEYDFVVAPGADAKQVKLQFTGVSNASVADNGDLVLQVAGSDAQVRFKAPVSYQRGADGQLQPVASSYRIDADGSIGFDLGAYDHSRELVIDPVLQYATYFGDSGNDTALAVATDASGNIYVAGHTTSTSGVFASGSGGGGDMFIAKFSPDLSTLVWSTRIGGTGDDQANAIAVDANGNVAVGGWTKSGNFPGAPPGTGLFGALAGGEQALLIKLDSTGSVSWVKGFDGNGNSDTVNAVGFDSAGNVYASGQISQTGLLSGVLGSLLGSSDNAFIEKYASGGTQVYQQEFGGGATDAGNGLAVGSGGDVYVVGTTQSTNMPTTGGAQTANAGGSDGFLFHFDSSGTATYSTYIGGGDTDSADAVAIDGSGKAFVVGSTKVKTGSLLATTSGAFTTSPLAPAGKTTGYLREYDTAQTGAASLVYSSYLGGSQNDSPTGVNYTNGRVIVSGQASSSDFPVTSDAYQTTFSGNTLSLAVLNPVGGGSSDLLYGTFFGNSMTAGGLAVTGNEVVMVGSTGTAGQATTGAYQATKSGGNDGLVVRFSVNTAPVLSGAVQPPAILEDSGGGSGFLVSSLIAGKVTDPDAGALQGIALTSVDNTNGTWQYSTNGGTTWTAVTSVSNTSALLLASDTQTRLRFVSNANWNGSTNITFRAWDQTSGTAGGTANTSSNGGITAFSTATATTSQVVTAVNDAPVRTAGTFTDLVMLEDAPAANLGLGGLNYGPGGGTDEQTQTLTYKISALPPASLGAVQLSSGAAVTLGGTYSLTDLRSMKFQPAANANGGPYTFGWAVIDNGGTANGGVDTLNESLTITVLPQNDPPVANPETFNGTEDTPITLTPAQLLANDTDVEGDALTVGTVAVGTGGTVVLNADGSVTFTPTANFSGAATFKYKASDGQALSNFATVTINVAPVNDPPVLATGSVANVTAPEGATTSLGLGTVTYGPGGGADEVSQTLTYTVTGVPPSALGLVLLSDGSTAANAGTAYTLTQLQGMQFRPASGVNSGAGTFSFNVQDNGGTANGGVDTLAQSLTITVVNQAPTVSGNITVPGILEDAPAGSGTLVGDLIAGKVSDPGGVVGIAITAADNTNGAWQVSRNNGSTWSALGAVSDANATLLAADGSTRVRFVPNANWNGNAAFTFRGWDQTGGTAGQLTGDTRTNGGTSAFSGATGTATITVAAVDDQPVLTAGSVSNVTATEGATTALGLSALAYGPGGGADEAGQTLTYTITSVPSALGQVLLSDGTTVVDAGTSYTLTQLQGMQFRPGTGVNSGSGTFSFNVQDNGGTANGGVDTLPQSLTITVVNQAPTLTGDITVPGVLEDAPAGSGTLVSDLVAGNVSDPSGIVGIAITAADNTNGSWQVSRDNGSTWSALGAVSDASAKLLAADGVTRVRFAPNPDWNGSATFTFRAWDQSGGTAGQATGDTRTNGGASPFSANIATATITVGAVNDAPVLAAGSASNVTTTEGSATSLGLGGLAYGPGGGADEAGQTLTYTITSVPSALGQVLLSDGTTVVNTGTSYTLTELQGMQFRPGAVGIGTFSFDVQDNGGTANGGVDTLSQSLTITVLNQAPTLTGDITAPGVLEDAPAGNGTLVSGLIAGKVSDPGGVVGIAITAADNSHGTWQVTRDGGSTWANLGAVSDTNAALLAADGATRLRFVPGADWNGDATFTFRAWDQSGGTAGQSTGDTTANGGTNPFSANSATATITVAAVNDAPVLASGSVRDVTVTEGATTSFGLAGLTYGPGGGADEAGQSLTYTVTTVPGSGMGQLLLADGTTVVAAGMSYSLTDLQGMQFRPGAGVNSGTGTFSFDVQDNGGTANGGVDTLSQSLTITVVNQAPTLAGNIIVPGMLEDAPAGNGTLVSDLIASKVSDPSGVVGIAITAVDNSNGTWQLTRDGGTTWSNLDAVSDTNAALLAADGLTRVRFAPAANWNGNATFTFVAWDQSGGTAGQGSADTSTRGGTSPFSANAGTATITVGAVNDAPVLTAASVANVTAAEGATTSLGVAGVTYGPGGGADEAGQSLTYTITAVPPAALGQVLLADGTTVVSSGTSYTLADLRGMQFRPGVGVNSGSGTFSFDVQDNGGTANGGVDTVSQSLTITVVNQAPTLTGNVTVAGVQEDAAAGTGTLVTDLIAGKVSDPSGVTGIAITAADNANGTWQVSRDNGTTWSALGAVSDTSSALLAADGVTRLRFVPAANWNGDATFTFRAWDQSGGTAGQSTADTTSNGGTTAFSANTATATITVGAVNDQPVLTAGSVSNVTVTEGVTTSLGLAGLAYGPGGGADEAGQTFTYTITSVPSALGQVLLSDGTTVASAGTSYTLAQLQGMQFRPGAGVNSGSGTFSFDVQDSGGTANGGVDTLSHALTITVVNQAPKLAGNMTVPGMLEDAPAGNGTLVSDLIAGKVSDPSGVIGIAITSADNANGTWQVSRDNGTTWNLLGAASDANATLLASDGVTRVRFVPTVDWNGSATFTFRAWDQSGGTAGQTSADATFSGGTSPFSANTGAATITVTAVNDAPVLAAGRVANVTATEGSTTSLGLGAVAYGPGGGADEAGQTLTYTITSVPSALGQVFLSDGTTVVSAGTSYTLTQLQGMQFRSGAGVNSGSGTFSFDVQDNGGTANGGVDTLSQSLTITVVNQAPTLSGNATVAGVLEDAPAGSGTLVTDLIAGKVSDPSGLIGIAITAADNANGTWQVSRDNGTTWNALGAPSDASATLLGADGVTRVRFVPAANWNGDATFTFRAWDQGGGTAGQSTADTTSNGGTTAFSANTATATITVGAVNDQPVLTTGSVSTVTVTEGATTSLGLAGLAYGPGGGADESGQTFTYTITSMPSALGQVLLSDGTTVVSAGTSYTLTQLQGMQFRPGAGVNSGSGTFSFDVQDSGGTANGGVDTLSQSLTITVVNQAPTLAGNITVPGMLEDAPAGNGTLVSDLIAGKASDPSGLLGIAITNADNSNGTWQLTRDAGTTWSNLDAVSDTNAALLAADGATRMRFVPAANWNGNANFTFLAWDRSGGTAGQATGDTTIHGGTSPFSANAGTATITVGAVNDAPVMAAGSVSNVTATEGSTASLGFTGLPYTPGGGADEAGQSLTYTITAVPPAALGNVVLSDGTTVVNAGTSYTLAELQGMQFRPAAGVNSGSGTFSFDVQDNGGTANGGADTLSQSLTVSVVNQAPTLLGNITVPGVLEDAPAGNGTLVSDLIASQVSDPGGVLGIAITTADNSNGTWQVTRDGGTAWSNLGAVSDTSAALLAADGATRLRFVPAANWNGDATFTFRAWDQSGATAGQSTAATTTNGGTSAFSANAATATITVGAVNDQPVLTAGAVSNVTVTEGATTSLGLAGVAYGPGGGADEAGQAFTYTITAVPAAALGDVVLADGTTIVTAGSSYTLGELQGMQFRPGAGVNSGGGTFSFDVQDSGGTANGGVDTLSQSLTLAVVNQAPAVTGNITVPGVLEDAPAGNGALVSDLVAGKVSDAGGIDGIAITAADNSHGTWQVSRDNGSTWSALGAVSDAKATLLPADGGTRLRFVPNADGNGSASFTFRAWDLSGGTAGQSTGDARTNGGQSPYSANTGIATIAVGALNDAPVLSAGTVSNVTVTERSTASLGLAGLAYGPGGGADEAGQTLTYTITSVPPSALGQVVLSDGTTVVGAGGSYTLTQLQGMQFRPGAGVNSGSGTFSFDVQDNGGTANGGVDTLSQSLTINVINQAPTLAGNVTVPGVLEDAPAGNGTLVSDLIAGKVSDPGGVVGIAITSADNSNGTWQASRDNGTTWNALGAVSDTNSALLAADGVTRVRFVPAANWNGNASFSFRAWDLSGATAGQSNGDTTSNGGTSAFSANAATATITVGAVNDQPVLTSGSVANVSATEGATTALGLGSVAYAPGGGSDEATQTLAYTATAVPPAALGQVVLADGSTVVTAGTGYTLAQLRGMQFLAAAGENSGTGTFAFDVRDDGGTGNGGADTLSQSLTITVVNQAPTLAGNVMVPGILEDAPAANGTLVSDLIAGKVSDPGAGLGIAITSADDSHGLWQVSRDGGTTWTALGVVSASNAALLPADSLARVRFVPAANWNGNASFTFRAWDQSGGTAGQASGDTTTNGGSSPFSANAGTATITVAAVNDAPVPTAGTVSNVTATEGSTTSLALAGVNYGPGGGADEAGQVLTYTVTAVPASALGQVMLADGTTVVSAGTSYTLTQLQGMQFRPGSGVTSGTGSFSFTVQDDGGTSNGGIDTLSQSLAITVVNQAPTLAGNVTVPGVLEDAPAGNGTLVSDVVAGKISDPSGVYGIAITSADNGNGTWQVTRDGGTTWSVVANAGATNATLLPADGLTRVRFVPAANWNGDASFTFRAWDRSGGTAGQSSGDTSINGGQSPYSAATGTASIHVTAVNDAPVLAAGSVSALTVSEGSGAVSLGLGGLSFGAGGGADETTQTLGYTVTGVPASSFGQVTLADGTVVAAGQSYSLAQLQGMQFTPAANIMGSATFAFQVQDDGGTATGGIDTLTQSLQIQVAPNHAPVLSGAGAMPSILEDASTNGGMLVSDLIAGHVWDVDPQARGGIAVTSSTSAGGSWQYSQDGGAHWSDFGNVSDSAARLLAANATTRVRFVPAADWNGTAGGLQFRAWDQTQGTSGLATADVRSNGGATAFSAAAATASLTVLPVDDAPVQTGTAPSSIDVTAAGEPTSLALGSLDYAPGGGADESQQALTITVTGLPAAGLGAVTLADGTPVHPGTSYTLAQLQGMQFVANADGASGSSQFTWTVADNGSTANGGVDRIAQAVQLQVAAPAPKADTLPGPVTTPPAPQPAPAPAPAPTPALPSATGAHAPAPAPAPSPGRVPGGGAGDLFTPVTAGGTEPTAPGPMLIGGSSGFAGTDIDNTVRLNLRNVFFDGAHFIALQAQDFTLQGVFGLGTPEGDRAAEVLQRSLRSTNFTDALDHLRRQVRDDLKLEQSVTVSVAGVSLGLSLVYVLWLIRGGVLMGSYLSALPAWRILDPLPVLPRPEEETEEEDEDLGHRGDEGRNVLRGFA